MRDFADRTVYVVGGSSGIGLSIARALSARGAHVVIFARAKDRLDRAREQVAACAVCEPQRFSCMQVDVCNGDEVLRVMAGAVSRFGPPDVLINCAGRARPARFEEMAYEQFDETMKTNLYGAWTAIAALLPHMKERGGYIVNVSSMAGLIGVFGYTDYSASKFAVIGLSEA
ncbi:MAG: SDR family NAD(P)-dependent oxidoreductase, partial [Chloroflexota bacterium]|nr:SDR family NAD(P)-dependent oxidoreductase [Chloroflexota bacterium]